jgi:16S rRNA (cytosine967-C5)-methyltransferase
MQGQDARRLAYRILVDYDRRDAYLNVLLSSYLAGSSLARRDRALVTEIVQGTVRMKLALDWAVSRFSDRELNSLDAGVLWVLRMSAYQVLFMSVPDYAACDLAAELTRSEIGVAAVGYVNGVLRALVRGSDSIEWPRREREPARYLEIRRSHPRWVVDMWRSELGEEQAESLCAADNVQPALSIRCNLSRTTRGELSALLSASGIEVREGLLAPEALLLKGGGSPVDLEEYRRGLFSVQDQGSMMIGHAVAPRPGMRVLDLCAAPGGKANHIAEMMNNVGSVTAVDINPGRLRMVEQSALRLGNTIVEIRALDARRVSSEVGGKYDRVLVDAPCTGLGTLGRRPDARWRKAPEDVERLSALQRSLLSEGAKMVEPGGMLVYSTCTISRRENQEVALSFTESDDRFEPFKALGIAGDSSTFIQLLPGREGCDGTFIAAWKRRA